MTGRSVSYAKAYPDFLKTLTKTDRSVETTINEKLEELAHSQHPPRGKLTHVGGRPIYKERFRIGNRTSGRLIVFIDDTRVIALAAYAKNKITNMTGDEVLDLIDWE